MSQAARAVWTYTQKLALVRKLVLRISHHTKRIGNRVPLFRRSSGEHNLLPQRCLFQAVAHRGEKCRPTWAFRLSSAVRQSGIDRWKPIRHPTSDIRHPRPADR